MLKQHDIDPFKVSSPRIFLVRMLVFLVLGGLLVVILYRQISVAFLANPGLNALIIGVLLIGILLAFSPGIRFFSQIAWVEDSRLSRPEPRTSAPPAAFAATPPLPLSPLA